MNARIKYLVEQANARTFINEDGSLTPELKKFTELVVKECTNIVLHYTDVDEGVRVARKHFGVEE